jgi:kumamolisin
MRAKPHFRRRTGLTIAARMARAQQPQNYTPLQVAQIYSLPVPANGGSLDGAGQTIGVVELGGAFYQSDLSAYLRTLGLPDNQVTVKAVGGASVQPDPGGADTEVMLDVCIIAALAPKAKIIVYFGSNDDSGMPACIHAARTDGCDVISISWGSPESQSPPSYRAAVDQALQACEAAGVSVYVAAGDNGSRDGTNSPVTDYPASSPYAIACGGTNLQPDGTETVWNDGSQGGATGGGFSGLYAKPAFQNAEVPGVSRGVPDVAGNADPETGWLIQVNGSLQSVGGTSAVAPMWAAIHALLNQHEGQRIGDAADFYYGNPDMFRDTISGTNGDYTAGPGWDACTGLGSPKGKALFGGKTTAPPPPASPAPTPTIAQAKAIVDADFAAAESAVLSQRPFLGPLIAAELKSLQAQIDSDLQKLASAPAPSINWQRLKRESGQDFAAGRYSSSPLFPELETSMHEHESLPKAQANAAEVHAQAIDNIFGLPPGTILGVITKLLPVILQLFGGAGAAPKK